MFSPTSCGIRKTARRTGRRRNRHSPKSRENERVGKENPDMTTRACWLGHACILLESDGKRVLIDSFLTGNPAAATTADKVQADFILVSHGHGDHVGDAVAIAKRTGATVIANYEISLWLEKQGVTKVHGQQHGGGHDYPFGRVKLTLAFHASALPHGRYRPQPCASYISINDA